MKRKLVFGVGLVAFIFILSGLFVTRSLTELRVVTDLKDRLEDMMASYDRLLYLINDDQSQLYALEAGYRRDPDMLRRNVQETKKLFSSLMEGYAAYTLQPTCKLCHSQGKIAGGTVTLERVHHHEETLSAIYGRIAGYEEKINRIVESGGTSFSMSLLKDAARDSEEIEALILKVRNPMERMNTNLEKLELSEVRRSNYSIVIAIALCVLLSVAIVVTMIRSITGPVNILVHGIERVSSGDYSSKVDLRSDDEMGFLARTFNQMTEKLSEVTAQREALMGDLKDLNATLEQRVQDATEALRVAHERVLRNETLSAVGTFAAGVAHELATPISSIMNYFGMVKERIPKEDSLAEDVRIIDTELKRCYVILRGMLDLAKTPVMEKEPTDINGMLRGLLALVKYQPAFKRTVTIEEDLSSDVPLIPAVPGQLRQVFTNIIVNALESMPKGGTLRVSTSLGDDKERLIVNISDTGYGIPQSELNKVFQPFYTSRRAGTGLGLSISYGIIRSHGGDIEVKSEEGTGTLFTVYLPISAKVAAEVDAVAGQSAKNGVKR